MGRKNDKGTAPMWVEGGQLRLVDKSLEQKLAEAQRVECLGKEFPNDDARREHFLQRLREKLADPEFRKTPGFPKATDEDILRLSDPPYYTACPNPFLDELVRCYGRPYDPKEPYHREPFAVDTSVGKTDALYKAHSYHTKVPHLAIVPSILHYTKPGDIVLDGFCGSGMTGVAAQWCGSAPAEYRKELEHEWKQKGWAKPEWGARRAILSDLSPAATFIAAGYNLPFDAEEFGRAAQRLLAEVDAELGWMYETLHKDGKTVGKIDYTVWSEVFACPQCTGEVVFVEEALNKRTKRTRDEFPCPHCGKELDKDSLERLFETLVDPATGEPWRRIRLKPVLIRYSIGKKEYEKKPDAKDLATLDRIAALPFPVDVPSNRFPIERMYHGSRLEPKGFTRAHHLFTPRAGMALGALWARASAAPMPVRRQLLFFVEQAIWSLSVLNRFRPTGYSQVGQYMTGIYYVPSQHAESSVASVLGGKAKRLAGAFRGSVKSPVSGISTGHSAAIPVRSASIDYVFTDPPFGKNIPYADLNLLVESWHRVTTDAAPEAIVDTKKGKEISEYQDLMRSCFAEYHRVLKPGRWITVVFSNSENAVWRAIQEAMGVAGFVIADVRTLDKQQHSYRQETSDAVNQDLVISAYKPSLTLTKRFELGESSTEGAWAFVREQLEHVPVFVGSESDAEVLAERTPQMLLDRMTAFHVQRGLAVPMSSAEFLAGLPQRFIERDGMYFLPDQAAAYDRKRAPIRELKQLPLFVKDEATAIQWVRLQLGKKPQSFPDLQPQFMREIQGWSDHEATVELKEILEQNFLHYDGSGPVPGPIHAYLSSNFKNLRNREKDDPALVAQARDCWYVPDPNRLGDLEKLREKALLKEFEEYRSSKKKLKQFRTEAVRAGFKKAWDERDYALIVEVADKLPENILQEDAKLLMYADVARRRLGSH